MSECPQCHTEIDDGALWMCEPGACPTCGNRYLVACERIHEEDEWVVPVWESQAEMWGIYGFEQWEFDKHPLPRAENQS